jgi:hypothetical protein
VQQRVEARSAEAHRKTVSSEIDDIAAFLQEMLGRNLVAYLSNVADPKMVTRWARAENQPRPESEKRLRAAFQVIQLLLSADSSHVARAWFIGMNPQLEDDAPAQAIRDGRFKDVLIAAKAYVAGG